MHGCARHKRVQSAYVRIVVTLVARVCMARARHCFLFELVATKTWHLCASVTCLAGYKKLYGWLPARLYVL